MADGNRRFLSRYNGGKDIYDHYLSRSLKIGQHINSPFRVDSNSGSFNLYINETNHLVYFKDHVNDYSGDAVDFVRLLFRLNDFREAQAMIELDLANGLSQQQLGEKLDYLDLPRHKTNLTQNAIITYKKREWLRSDQLFWEPYLVSTPILERYRVFPVKEFSVHKSDYSYTRKELPSDPIYVIEFPSGRCKIYRPLTFNQKANKWRSNTRIEDVFGLELLADDLPCVFIIGGNKDTVAMAALIGYDLGIAMPSESVTVSPFMYALLKKKAKQIYVLYDIDSTGRTKTQKLIQEYPDIVDASEPISKINQIDPKVKDLSDAIKKFHTRPDALDVLRQYYFNLINKNID